MGPPTSLLPPPVPLAGLMRGWGGKRPVSLPTGRHGPQAMAGEGSLGPGEWKGDVIAGGEGPQCPPGTRKVALRPCSVVASVLSLSFSRPCGEAGSLGLGGGWSRVVLLRCDFLGLGTAESASWGP